MASIGLKYLAWARMKTEPQDSIPTYYPGKVLGKMISTNLAVTNSEGELYADDALAEYIAEFSSAEFTAETDHISLQDQAELYGAKYVDGELQHYSGDNAPYGGYGGYQVLSVHNERKFRVWLLPKAKAVIPDETGATKGGSVSFATQPLKTKVTAPNYGPWKRVKEFTDEAAAKAFIDTFLGVATWHQVNVQVNGADDDEGASPAGITSIAEGGSFELVITGTPTAIYDNGRDVTSGISGNTYSISAVNEDHAIAVIF